jgi:hypothetical protein
MAVKWNPIPVLLRITRRNQSRVGAAIASSASQVKHSQATGGVGGSLPRRVRARSLVKVGRAHVTTEFSKLGQKLLFFLRGTKRQKARFVKLEPDEAAVAREVEADAAEHFARREAKRRQ